jgi:predicted ATPase
MHLKSVTLHPESYPTREKYPFSLPIFQQAESILFTTPITLFVGENGAGKSTLIKAICQKSGIHIWRDTDKVRYQHNPYEEALHHHLTLEWTDGRVPGSFFGSDIFQYFTQVLDEWAKSDPGQLKYFGGKSLITQSHGQGLMSYFNACYKIKGLFFLDEPETALSPKSQLELLSLFAAMSAAGHAQFIVATHSPILLACPGAVIYSFDQVPLSQVQYEDTSHYQIYHEFMADRGKYLKQGGFGTTAEERRRLLNHQ